MVGIYCRISKRKEAGKDVSITNQKEEGVKFANTISMKYKFFVDEGISGTKDEVEDRPAFAELFKAIEKKDITAVYCIDQSRLERNPKIWQLFQLVVVKNDCKYYPNGKETDLSDPITRMASGMVSLTNELYSSLTSKKVKLSINTNALSGKSHGMSAYGYEKDKEGYVKINSEQAEIVRRIYQLSLSGIGTYTIANTLNEEGVPTKFNSFKGEIEREDKYTGMVTTYKKEEVRWRGNVLRDMIINPIYKGFKQWKGQEIEVPAIIDSELWERVNKNLKLNKKNVGKKEEYNYLLNGIIFCNNCGLEIRGKKRLKGNDNAYKCKGKRYPHASCEDSRGISIPKLETFIIKHLFGSKDLKRYLSNIVVNADEVDSLNKQLARKQSQLQAIEKRISRSYDLLLDPDFKDIAKIKEEYKLLLKSKEDITASIELVENKIHERTLNNRKKKVNNLIDGYSTSANFSEIKKLVHSLIERITIQHNKEKKGGYFVIGIKYNGFDETSIFSTDWQANKWLWINRKRVGAVNDEDLKEDMELIKDLYGYYKIEGEINPKLLQKGLVSHSKHSIIHLNNDELVLFD